MSRITLSSPAKLNLFLKVQNKRPDGFHNIVTVFERIDLKDRITFSSRKRDDKIRIKCNHPDVPIGPKNLVYKVAQTFQQRFGIAEGVGIEIKKRIPIAAGLAGGSSNAATALLGLNRLWRLNLSKEKLLLVARKIGSDVPFFLHNTSFGLGRERGDKVQPLNMKTKLWHILVVPRIKMYSWKVYGGLNFANSISKKHLSGANLEASPAQKGGCTNVLTKINDDVNILIHNLKKDKVLDVSRMLVNDLETEVIRISPRLEKLKKKLKSLNAKGVMISGSGPSVFGLTMTKEEAESMKSVLSKRFAQVFVVRTL